MTSDFQLNPRPFEYSKNMNLIIFKSFLLAPWRCTHGGKGRECCLAAARQGKSVWSLLLNTRGSSGFPLSSTDDLPDWEGRSDLFPFLNDTVGMALLLPPVNQSCCHPGRKPEGQLYCWVQVQAPYDHWHHGNKSLTVYGGNENPSSPLVFLWPHPGQGLQVQAPAWPLLTGWGGSRASLFTLSSLDGPECLSKSFWLARWSLLATQSMLSLGLSSRSAPVAAPAWHTHDRWGRQKAQATPHYAIPLVPSA